MDQTDPIRDQILESSGVNSLFFIPMEGAGWQTGSQPAIYNLVKRSNRVYVILVH